MHHIKYKKWLGIFLIVLLIGVISVYMKLGNNDTLTEVNTFKTNNNLSDQTPMPYGIGVAFHFTGNPPDIMMMKTAGINVARTDLFWSKIEKVQGKYDYTEYDELTDGLIKSGIKPYYILNYSNQLYEKNFSIVTKEGQEAFVNYVDDVTKRYKGHGIVWEIWNEPNLLKYWDTRPNYEDYSTLVIKVSKVIRKNDPSGIIVAPALAGLNDEALMWLDEILKKKVLDNIDAISVHPYRTTSPETVIQDYKTLRDLLKKYKKDFPIISGEWGYSTGKEWYNLKLTEKQQAQYLVRMFLINEYQEIPISIWYDWKNDGTDSNEGEHNFGIRQNDVSKSKEAFIALSTMTNILSGYVFSNRIDVGNPNDFVLEFSNLKGENVTVFWTTDIDHQIKFSGQGKRQIISMYGDNLGNFILDNSTTLEITASPRYLILH
ncbi:MULTISPECIES: beta-galactosidase [Bacillaceae]|uniref:beta-galactosidase n=1 Tax=Bacillaceae TaxID=186817 RepID=UPI000A5D91ED|nr:MULTISPECIES: beta-galactosidase [Bacillaceae]MCF7623644.1 beta-galactosidase [Peribacillus frigoritolerans]PRA94481.1 glycoside hydrolase family 5 [Peribacillus simplex]